MMPFQFIGGKRMLYICTVVVKPYFLGSNRRYGVRNAGCGARYPVASVVASSRRRSPSRRRYPYRISCELFKEKG